MEVFLQSSSEDSFAGGYLRKQSHRGVEFHVVRVAKDIFDGSVVDRVDELSAFAESKPEQWVI